MNSDSTKSFSWMGEIYTGSDVDGIPHGVGKLKSHNYEYVGFFEKGEPTYGKISYSMGLNYEGKLQFEKGYLVTGIGQIDYVPEKQTYKGQFYRGEPHGEGEMTYNDGTTYKGQWLKGAKHGKGIEKILGQLLIVEYDHDVKQSIIPLWGDQPQTSSSSTHKVLSNGIYEGPLQDGHPIGPGILTYKSGEIYEGEFQEGIPHGKGQLSHLDGSKYVGPFKNNQKHGQGILTIKNQTFKIKYINGKLISKIPLQSSIQNSVCGQPVGQAIKRKPTKISNS